MKKINLDEFKKLKNKHLIDDETRIKWWGRNRDEFYAYKPEILVKFDYPKPLKFKQGYQSFIKEVKFAEADPYMDVPPEDKTWHYVIQAHFRGSSLHYDLRLERENDLLGWTLMVQMPDTVKEPITTLQQAKEWHKKNLTKIDWEKGEIRKRTIKGGVIRRADIRAVKKAEEPIVWLNDENNNVLSLFDLILEDQIEYFVEGIAPIGTPGSTANYPGVFLIIDKGIVEYGSNLPFFHEYFLSGGKLKEGRYCFRAISQKEEFKELVLPEGVKEETIKEPFYWVFIQPDDQRPYCLSERAKEKNWLPPTGYSALPKKYRKNVPDNLKYWLEKDKNKAIEKRNKLMELEELDVQIEKGSEGTDYKLFRIWWKRTNKEGKPVIVIRWGASSQYYLFRIDDMNFECEYNPLESPTSAIQKKYKTNIDKLKDRELEPGEELNPTKNTSAWAELIESGKAIIFDKKEDFIKFEIKNRLYICRRENPKSDIWYIEETQLPAPKKDEST